MAMLMALMAIRIATMAIIMAILIAIHGNAKWPYMAMLMAIKAN